MDLLVIRHAIAMEREDFAAIDSDDDRRPLTDAGARKMRRVASGIRALVDHVDLIATSPLTRAMQTAQIVSGAYGTAATRTVDALRPENTPKSFIDWVRANELGDVCAIVGHEPNLSQLVTWLMTGVDESRVVLKKGGACLVGFGGAPGAGAGTLRWLLTPSQLIERAG